MKTALSRARELQDAGMPCWNARCQASREFNCSVGDINRAYKDECTTLRAAKEKHDTDESLKKYGDQKKLRTPPPQLELFGRFLIL